MIEFKNIYFIRDDKVLLNNINLKINEGENWLVLGPNGSGKSTLFSLLKVYTVATKGSMKVFDTVFGESNWNNVKDRIRIVSSTMNKFNDTLYKETVYEIVLSGLQNKIGIFEKETREEREETLEFLKKFDFYHMKDKRYEVLSAGEKQKTLILRSLIANPDILVLDEPCASLDLHQKEKILEFLKSLNKNLIYITHDISEILENITHVVLLKNSKILAKGKREEVLTDENLSKLYDLNLKISYGKNKRPIVEIL